MKNRWVTTDRSERPTRCELQFIVFGDTPVPRTATAMKLHGVRSARSNEHAGSKRSVMSDTEPLRFSCASPPPFFLPLFEILLVNHSVTDFGHSIAGSSSNNSPGTRMRIDISLRYI